jgi:hypothetical protein
MSSFQKAGDLAQLDFQVVLADFQSKAHLLHFQSFGLLPVLLGLLRFLVIVFTPVNDAGDRRVGIGTDFYQVQSSLLGGG